MVFTGMAEDSESSGKEEEVWANAETKSPRSMRHKQNITAEGDFKMPTSVVITGIICCTIAVICIIDSIAGHRKWSGSIYQFFGLLSLTKHLFWYTIYSVKSIYGGDIIEHIVKEEIRCACHKLIAIQRGNYIYIKCRGCKNEVKIPVQTILKQNRETS